ncbi:hypothetical protein Pcinc_022099 [Petrolisthes cinctipes]|uniref:Chitin-binding type-2 domain-containing protein n=1 Tax=Petrolisthes cinctipes TaxID=88211 RepID=A0AAE1KGI2_PETCI|nr:hypothetical protein Pcinc_022099 [Petrolisthes cinctipes]
MSPLSYSLLLFQAISLFLICFPHSVVQSSCQLDCTGKQQGDKVADPRNCYKYYYCLANELPSDASLYCPEGAPVFDPLTNECSPTATCTITCFKECHTPCNNTMDYVGDPLNCGIYYVCLPSGADGPFECPLNVPNFDGVNCVADPSVCCNEADLCNSFCMKEGIEIPYPYDCRSFYLCSEYGPPNESNLFTCPNGMNFDVYMGHCSSTAECKTLCYH